MMYEDKYAIYYIKNNYFFNNNYQTNFLNYFLNLFYIIQIKYDK